MDFEMVKEKSRKIRRMEPFPVPLLFGWQRNLDAISWRLAKQPTHSKSRSCIANWAVLMKKLCCIFFSGLLIIFVCIVF